MSPPVFIVIGAILLAPVSVRAQASSDTVPMKAHELADRGRAFHDAGDYAQAIAAFTQAYVIAPSPALLFNLAQAYRLQGNCEDAQLMYRRYLATNPSPERRALAKTHLATVERCVDEHTLHMPAETATANLTVPPPYMVTMTATVPAPSHKAEIEKAIGAGLALGGGAALVAAAYYAVQAHDASNTVEDAYTRHAKGKDVAPIDARGKAAARTAQIFGVGGALGIASGVVMYVIGKHTERAPLTPVTVGPRDRGVEVSISWAF